MQADRQNYKVLEGHDQRAISAQEEKTWSVLSHLSMFLNLFTGFLGPVAALIIWLVYKDRSRKVAFHALESMWYQIGWLVILAVGWTLTGLLTMILIGFLLIPVMAVASVVPSRGRSPCRTPQLARPRVFILYPPTPYFKFTRREE